MRVVVSSVLVAFALSVAAGQAAPPALACSSWERDCGGGRTLAEDWLARQERDRRDRELADLRREVERQRALRAEERRREQIDPKSGLWTPRRSPYN